MTLDTGLRHFCYTNINWF